MVQTFKSESRAQRLRKPLGLLLGCIVAFPVAALIGVVLTFVVGGIIPLLIQTVIVGRPPSNAGHTMFLLFTLPPAGVGGLFVTLYLTGRWGRKVARTISPPSGSLPNISLERR
jgi:hypothetical protein